MLAEWFEKWKHVLRCPADRSALVAGRGSDSTEGKDAPTGVICCAACGREYPVVNGIVRFIREQQSIELDDQRKVSEMQARDAAAQTYEQHFTRMKEALYTPPILKAMHLSDQDIVGDLGCGTGRIASRYISRVNRVIGLDFSLESLKVFTRRLPVHVRQKVLLVQADLCHPPLAPRILTKAVSSAVLEHLPTPLARRAAVASIAELLRPGGLFTCTVYNWSKQRQRDGLAGIGDNALKEGFHDTGIYYYNFDEVEFRDLLRGAGMQVDLMQGLLVPIRGARVIGSLVVPLNRWLSRTHFGIRHAQFLLARARVPVTAAAAA